MGARLRSRQITPRRRHDGVLRDVRWRVFLVLVLVRLSLDGQEIVCRWVVSQGYVGSYAYDM